MAWLAVVVLVAAATAEKLGDIEVITRGELRQDGLVPPDRIRTLVPPIFVQDDAPPPTFLQNDVPPPPLSYLPPVQTPLPIEPTPAPQVVTVDTLYQVPDQTPPVVQTTVSPPTGFYIPPTQQATAGGDNVHVGVVGGVDIGGSTGGDSYGFEDTYVGGPIEYEEDGGSFVTNLKDSKFALLGGVIGAKIAVAEGLKNAKESLVSGLTRSIAAKGAAFSSLKGIGYGHHEEDSYGGGSEGDVVGLGGGPGSIVTSGPYPAPNPGPATPYPIYPPYPQPVYPKPVYPVPVYPKPIYPLPVYPIRPSYRPKFPFSKLKRPFYHFQPVYGHSYGQRPW